MKQKIIISAGGTGGHMFPAAAVADELRLLGYDIILITDSRGMRFASDFKNDTIVELPVANIRSHGLITKIKNLFQLFKSIISAIKNIFKYKPQAIIGFGGYPSFPATIAGFLLGKKIFIHEQNAIIGRTNKALSSLAKKIFLSFEKTMGLPINKKNIHVGNPVRQQIIDASLQEKSKDRDTINILVTGGSQGAQIFSQIIPLACEQLGRDIRNKLIITHQTRPEDLQATIEAYKKNSINADVISFIDDMGTKLSNTDLVICRSGASTIAELCAIGCPALYVPLPTAADDQQTINASYMVEQQAGRLVKQDDFTPTLLAAIITEFYRTPEKLSEMALNAKNLGKINANKEIAEKINSIILS